jgi:hypothetical protein
MDHNSTKLRKHVYNAAFQALIKTQRKQEFLLKDEQKKQFNALDKAITQIENSYNKSKKHAIAADYETSLKKEPSIAQFINNVRYKSAILLFSLILTLFLLSKHGFEVSRDISPEKAQLEIVADKNLFKNVRVRGDGLVTLEHDRIRYDLDHHDTIKLNALDIIFKNSLAKKIQEIPKPSIITLHIQNPSGHDIQLQVSVVGLGKTFIKKFNMTESNNNEFFIVLENSTIIKENNFVVLRITLKTKSEKKYSKKSVILKKFVFSEL